MFCFVHDSCVGSLPHFAMHKFKKFDENARAHHSTAGHMKDQWAEVRTPSALTEAKTLYAKLRKLTYPAQKFYSLTIAVCSLLSVPGVNVTQIGQCPARAMGTFLYRRHTRFHINVSKLQSNLAQHTVTRLKTPYALGMGSSVPVSPTFHLNYLIFLD